MRLTRTIWMLGVASGAMFLGQARAQSYDPYGYYDYPGRGYYLPPRYYAPYDPRPSARYFSYRPYTPRAYEPSYVEEPASRPSSCGQYRYWNGDYCADARYERPYLGPRY